MARRPKRATKAARKAARKPARKTARKRSPKAKRVARPKAVALSADALIGRFLKSKEGKSRNQAFEEQLSGMSAAQRNLRSLAQNVQDEALRASLLAEVDALDSHHTELSTRCSFAVFLMP